MIASLFCWFGILPAVQKEPSPPIQVKEAREQHLKRDSYGVPVIRTQSLDEAMFWAGYATAEDRLWQMERSRRAAQSQLSAAFGESFLAADRQQFQQFYTYPELEAQFKRLPKPMQEWFRQYARGVNNYVAENGLPSEFKNAKVEFRNWDVIDSVAITVQLLQTFGRGGSGELRNLALYKYLEAQPKIGSRALDVFDDFLWQNEPRSIPTCFPEDDLVKPPVFPSMDPVKTVRHLTSLPDFNFFELLPGVRVVARDEAKSIQESLATPYKSGSYCIVIGKRLSQSGAPLLLSGPQMGFTVPSIVHEISIHTPKLHLAGMTVPGVPGVMIGNTQHAAWGLTTGVADTEDLVSVGIQGNQYRDGDRLKPIIEVSKSIQIPGKAEPVLLKRRSTTFGPIVFEVLAKEAGFARQRAYEGRELQSYEAVAGLWTTKSKGDFERSVRRATMNFNCFIALSNGDIGWRYLGDVPVRSDKFDPRFPLPSGSDAKWKGMIPFEQMPSVWNPRRGWIANWNNKPVAWWPNLDSPTWGEAFRNGVIVDLLAGSEISQKKYRPEDLERAVATIAQTQSTWRVLKEFAQIGDLAGFNGMLIAGQKNPALYLRFLTELRNELFLPVTGNFASAENFALVAQPDVMLKALRQQTKVDYLRGRTPLAVCASAYERAFNNLGSNVFQPSTIPVVAGLSIPYRDRGTYLQITEFGKTVEARNVVTPGVAASGPHANDQADLARKFMFKPMIVR